jgi:mono/diheme cytochrome c family protein
MLPKKIKPLYINIALAGLVFFLMAVNLLVYVDPESRNPVVLDGMQTSDAIYTQESGRRLNMVVEGTVRHGEVPLHYGSGPVESMKAGDDLTNPYSRRDKKAVDRGALVYDRFCMACHVNKSSDPKKEVVKRGVPNAPALMSKRVKGFKDGYIFNYITNGGALMPAHGPQIPAEDRWKVIAYIRHRLNEEKGSLE